MAKELLRNVYCFKELNAGELGELEKIATAESHNQGEDLFMQGDRPEAMFVIKLGSIRIKHTTPTGETIVISVLGGGALLGEMAFVNREQRTATAEVLEATEVVRIAYAPLENLLKTKPTIAASFYKAIAFFLTQRLGATTRDLGFAREKLASHG